MLRLFVQYPWPVSIGAPPTVSLPKRTYTVEGMTCGHCSKSVMEAVLPVSGVSAVDVDLDSGVLTVAGEQFDDGAISAAVDEAGYTLVS
jgi:copper chaperone